MSRPIHRRRQRRHLTVLTAAAAGAAAALLPLRAQAATETFDNGGADGGLWSNNVNWNPDGAVEANDARFNGTTGSTLQGTVTSIVDADRSVLSLSYTQHATSNTTVGDTIFHTTQINDGVTLTITGNSGPTSSALQVGANIDNLTNNNLTYTSFVNQPGFVTGGTLAINNATADLVARQCSSNTAGGTRNATLDMSGLSNFNATLRNINVAVGDASGTWP